MAMPFPGTRQKNKKPGTRLKNKKMEPQQKNLCLSRMKMDPKKALRNRQVRSALQKWKKHQPYQVLHFLK